MEGNKEGMNMCGGKGCGCGCGMGGGHRGFRIGMKIFYLILLIVVFCFGIQLGELKTLSREMHQQPRMMISYGAGNMMNGTSTRGW